MSDSGIMLPRFSLRLVREPGKGKYNTALRSPEEMYRMLAWMGELDREQFVVIMLDVKCRPIGLNVVSIGTVTSSLVHPREVFKPAILCNAHSIVLAHNHPTGNTLPSREDKECTIQLKKTGEVLGIGVIDHLIVGDDEFYSFRTSQPEIWGED